MKISVFSFHNHKPIIQKTWGWAEEPAIIITFAIEIFSKDLVLRMLQ